MANTEARKRFIDVMLAHSTRATENFEIIMKMASRLYQAEAVGFKLDPDSVEKALKNIMGVEPDDSK